MNFCNCCGAFVEDQAAFEDSDGYCAECDGDRVSRLPEMDAFFQVEKPEQPEVYPTGGGRWAYEFSNGRRAAGGFASRQEALDAARAALVGAGGSS